MLTGSAATPPPPVRQETQEGLPVNVLKGENNFASVQRKMSVDLWKNNTTWYPQKREVLLEP